MKLLLLVVFLLLISTTHSQQQVDVLKISNVKFPLSKDPAASINAGYTKDITEFTCCYRILVDSYNDGYPIFLIAWHPDVEVKDSWIAEESSFFLEATNWLDSGHELDGFQAAFTMLFRNVPGGGKGNRSMPIWHHLSLPRFVEPGKWSHFCTSYSSTEHILHKYQDGHKVFSHFFTDEVESPLPNVMFDNVEIGHNFRGLFTDLNIYSSFFKEDDMKDWTSGCSQEGGDIFQWAPNKVNMIETENVKNVSFIKMDSTEVCPDPDKKFPREKPVKSTEGTEKKRFQPRTYKHDSFIGLVVEFIENNAMKDVEEAKDMCFRLNGELTTVPQTEEEEIVLTKIVRDYIMKKVSNNKTYLEKNDFKVQYWLAGETVEIAEDIFTSNREQAYSPSGESTYFHPITGVKLDPVKPLTRPDYSTNPMFKKLCMRCFDGINKRDPDALWWSNDQAWCLPTICSQLCPNSVICQFNEEPTFKLRGLCKDSLADTQYKLAEPEPFNTSSPLLYQDSLLYGEGVRGFVGPKGWVISHNSTDNKWRMSHYYYTDYTITMLAQNNLPFGRHKWRIENNICNEGKTSFETLQLSACPDGGFTCDDGKCLHISQRCNNIEVRILF